MAEFTVHTENAGEGKVDVRCIGPKGANERVSVNDNGDGTYSCYYTPTKPGDYVIAVTYSGRDAGASPYRVKVDPAAEPGKVTASGPGLEDGNQAGKVTHFDVNTKDAGKGVLKVQVAKAVTRKGEKRQEVGLKQEEQSKGVTRYYYNPQEADKYEIEITFAGTQIKESPFFVTVIPAYNARNVQVRGRGVQARGLRVGEDADFPVLTENAGEAELEVKVTGPGNKEIPVKLKKVADNKYEGSYKPKAAGNYKVEVKWGGDHAQKSPFNVSVAKKAGKQKIRAYGPGLEGGIVKRPAAFVVETIGEEIGQLGFSIEGLRSGTRRRNCQEARCFCGGNYRRGNWTTRIFDRGPVEGGDQVRGQGGRQL